MRRSTLAGLLLTAGLIPKVLAAGKGEPDDFLPRGSAPTLVADVNDVAVGQLDPEEETTPATLAEGLVVFRAIHPLLGREAWVTDGTAAGTRLLADTVPGGDIGRFSGFIAAGERVFFVSESVLWETDGTPAGTRPTGLRIPAVAGLAFSNSSAVMAWDGERLFAQARVDGQTRLVAVDENGVTPIIEAGGEPLTAIQNPVPAPGGGIFFGARTPPTDAELFFTDGTPAGTRLVADLEPAGSSMPGGFDEQIARVGTKLFFAGFQAGIGEELLVFDTATEVLEVFDIDPGPGSSDVQNLVAHGEQVYYSAEDGDGRRSIYRYSAEDGSNERITDPALELNLPCCEPLPILAGLCFSAFEPATGFEPYCFEPGRGVTCLGDLVPGGDSSGPGSFVTAGDRVYFRAEAGPDQFDAIFRYDGPGPVVQQLPPPGGDDFVLPFAAVGSTLLFERSIVSEFGDTDRTFPASTSEPGSFEDLSTPFAISDSDVTARTAVAGGILFEATRPDEGRDLWFFDGEQATPVTDQCPGPDERFVPDHIVVLGEIAYLDRGNCNALAAALYAFDGRGLSELAFDEVLERIEVLAATGRQVLFEARDTERETGIYAYDPVRRNVADVGGPADDVVADDGRAFLFTEAALTVFLGRRTLKLLTADTLGEDLGDLEGAAVLETGVAVPNRGSRGAPVDDTLVAILRYSFSDYRLLVTDGSTQGTEIFEIPGVRRARDEIFAVGAVAAFSVTTDDNRGALYITDGTAEGTRALVETGSAAFLLGANARGWFYSTAFTEVGRELAFVTPDGTVTPIDLPPGDLASDPLDAIMVNDLLLFTAFTPDRGSELWLSNGTVAGTRPIPEIQPGPGGQRLDLVGDGNRVWFGAFGPGGEGKELWTLEVINPLFGDGFETP